VALRPGMVIDRSVTVRPGTYRLASADLATPAITIRGGAGLKAGASRQAGGAITIDFNGATLLGGPEDADPDGYTGLGVLIDGGTNVTVRNAVIRGYKVGLLARAATRLHLTKNDLSYNWKQRLFSGIEHESLVDWMSYHNNEKDEWLRYGAAIYLADCRDAEIDHNTVTQGQNGLMMTRSEGARIWNNSFTFLSAIGIGLYRSSRNLIAHNRVDWCVRGYSHGSYNRGQDSAGILMYEQSSFNQVAFNSVTHGGDGLFLWAGQSTLDTGQGGASANLFYRNDFSHAPANGIEATFSRNQFIENRVEDNWHGVWGGYSFESDFIGNRFARNTEAIAIEHGQSNTIVRNTFDRDETAIHLWQNATQDPNWGYPKHRDTRSRDYYIAGNRFSGHKTALRLRDTRDVVLRQNTFAKTEITTSLAGETPNVGLDVPSDLVHLRGDHVMAVPPLAGGMDAMIPAGARRGREFIIVDEWGPYDFRSPKLWPAGRSDDDPLRLRVLGPEGAWKLARVAGAAIEPTSGRVPGEIVVTPLSIAEKAEAAETISTQRPQSTQRDLFSSAFSARSAFDSSLRAQPPPRSIDIDIELEYVGAEVVSPRGRRVRAGEPYRFGYRRFFAPVGWTARFFTFDEATDPLRASEAFRRRLAGEPAQTVRSDRLDWISGGAILQGLPRDRVALVADGETTLPAGEYELLVISDDGVRAWVDDALVLDRWTVHESSVDRAPLAAGTHRLKVEYFELTGFAELRVEIVKRAGRERRAPGKQ
jgi:hypothetical protein